MYDYSSSSSTSLKITKIGGCLKIVTFQLPPVSHEPKVLIKLSGLNFPFINAYIEKIK